MEKIIKVESKKINVLKIQVDDEIEVSLWIGKSLLNDKKVTTAVSKQFKGKYIEKKPEPVPVKDIDVREIEFVEFVWSRFKALYMPKILIEFCRYWTEHGPSQTKMRYEKQKIFSHKKRLITWAKRAKEGNTYKPGKLEADIYVEKHYLMLQDNINYATNPAEIKRHEKDAETFVKTINDWDLFLKMYNDIH